MRQGLSMADGLTEADVARLAREVTTEQTAGLLRALASQLEWWANKVEGNTVGMTDHDGEKFTEGYLHGLRDACGWLREVSEHEAAADSRPNEDAR